LCGRYFCRCYVSWGSHSLLTRSPEGVRV
jgi:hypothetical protein